jgi:hypothetical protein
MAYDGRSNRRRQPKGRRVKKKTEKNSKSESGPADRNKSK